MTIRIVLADDHPARLVGIHHELQAIPGFEIVGSVHNAAELLQVLQFQPCDVLVTDYVMPGDEGGDGMALIAALRERYPALRIVVFTTLDNRALSASLIDRGVFAVINKTSEVGLLSEFIRAAYATIEFPYANMRMPDARLSAREEEVVRLYVSGLSINEIARRVGRTKQTVSTQKSNAMLKLGLTRDADLFRFALETAMVPIGAQEEVAD